MITRIYDTSIDPDDRERAEQLFVSHVRPTFERFAGCHGIEMLIGIETRAEDLLEVAAISWWDSMDEIESALSSQEYEVAMAELRSLFVKPPYVRHFERGD